MSEIIIDLPRERSLQERGHDLGMKVLALFAGDSVRIHPITFSTECAEHIKMHESFLLTLGLRPFEISANTVRPVPILSNGETGLYRMPLIGVRLQGDTVAGEAIVGWVYDARSHDPSVIEIV